MPTAIGWPVKPFVFAMTMESTEGPKTLRRAKISAEALPPRAGV